MDSGSMSPAMVGVADMPSSLPRTEDDILETGSEAAIQGALSWKGHIGMLTMTAPTTEVLMQIVHASMLTM
jgi:uncharacterized linocin/CFP29 family protein